MTVEEIFSQLAAHMIEGLMVHSQLSDYFGFLGLIGYQESHKYHYFVENSNYKNLCNYYLKHYNKLIIDLPFKNPKVIPESWYQYSRHDVKEETRKNAIQNGLDRWVKWEEKTKNLYQQLYQELIDLHENASALELEKYIIDVDYELAEATQKFLELKAINFDMTTIIEEQKYKYDKSKELLKEINLC